MNCPRYHFHFLTLFPETISPWLTTSILRRAHTQRLFDFSTYDLKSFSDRGYQAVDDAPYGGGGGMVLRIEPLVKAKRFVQSKLPKTPLETICFTPAGNTFKQSMIEKIESGDCRHYLLVCGHYEGIDQRFLDYFVDHNLSLGEFVLTGGELPALVFVDALVRRIGGAIGQPAQVKRESFSLKDPDSGKRLIEHPHYTRPANFEGLEVPKVLLNGDHSKIESWRLENSKPIL